MNSDKILYDTVKESIKTFNKTRGKRKVLNPTFVRHSEIKLPYRKFRRYIEFNSEEMDAFDAVRVVARQVVPTLLQRKPRPNRVYLDIAESTAYPEKLMVRLIVLKAVKK